MEILHPFFADAKAECACPDLADAISTIAAEKWASASRRSTRRCCRGTQPKPSARAAYEARTGLVMQPLVLVDGEYSASLDGLTLGGERIVEIKCRP